MTRDLLTDPKFSIARDFFVQACQASRQWDSLLSAALAKYGDHGPQISGVGRDHFPDDVKAELRKAAGWVSLSSGIAWDARPKGVRNETMRKLARAVATRDGSGFYGPQPERGN
jgi:hypothetical protein